VLSETVMQQARVPF